jgi:3-oxoadipate enol-lactonase
MTFADTAKHPEVVEHVGEMVVRTSVEGFAKVAEAIRDFDLREQSTSIKTLTLVVARRLDTITADADESGGGFDHECKIRNA